MSVQYLTDQHFSNVGGRALRCNVKGIVFVMFKTENCQHCQHTIPLFRQLAQQDMRLVWAVIDVGQYRGLVNMSKTTNTPIRSVPMFILYVDGRPHANYKGKRTIPHIVAFLDKILASLNTSSQSFVPSGPAPQGGSYISQQDQMPAIQEEVMNLPKNVVPHNAPYLAYKPMATTYKT